MRHLVGVCFLESGAGSGAFDISAAGRVILHPVEPADDEAGLAVFDSSEEAQADSAEAVSAGTRR